MTARCSVEVYGLSLFGNGGSNADGDMDVSCEHCVVRYRSLRPADPLSREIVLSMMCVYDLSTSRMGRPRPE
jgi:hypothetical protein